MVFNFWEEINYFGKGKRFLKKGTKFFFNKEEEEMPQQIKFTNFIKKKRKRLNKIKFKNFFQKTETPQKKTETPQKKEETPQQN